MKFVSEIGPSSFFGAYQLIKPLEKKGKTREDVVSERATRHPKM